MGRDGRPRPSERELAREIDRLESDAETAETPAEWADAVEAAAADGAEGWTWDMNIGDYDTDGDADTDAEQEQEQEEVAIRVDGRVSVTVPAGAIPERFDPEEDFPV